jgi:hypothetical protein
MASPFGTAFDKLDDVIQRGIHEQLLLRRERYLCAMNMEVQPARTILLADTPGPGRPNTPGYHHTPFYSTRNSSLWLNRQLVEAGIAETVLLWFNTTLANGTKLRRDIINHQLKHNDFARVICLGNNAKQWFYENFGAAAPATTVYHPQAWKRFHSKEPYPLIDLLKHTGSS